MLTQALLVDDSRSVLDFLKRLLEADGAVQVTAYTDPAAGDDVGDAAPI
jgi:two-component system, response regulator RpfG